MLADIDLQLGASQFRQEIGLSKDSPVGDICSLVRQNGYSYSEGVLPQQYSAESRLSDNGDFCITYNRNHAFGERYLRFTVSHELAHWTIPSHFKRLQGEKLHRSQAEFHSNDEIEREADKFAINFLAPIPAFLKEMESKDFSPKTISHLSDFFGVSSYAAILHFMDLTDLSCTMVVCNENFEIEYERRSAKMKESYKMPFLRKQKLSTTTNASDCMKKGVSAENRQVMLSDWFEGFEHEIQASESVIRLGYNGKYLAMITPFYSDLREYVEQTEES